MTRMIKEEVEESERMVQRLASWGLLRLKVANSTNEKTDTHNRRSEARQGDLELVLSRGRLRPTLFVKAHITLDEWSVSIPKWMRPIAYSGTTAGGEPFWRRLAHEKRHGIKGEYTRIDDKDKRIDNVGKTLMYVLHSRTRASQLRRDAMVAPTRRKVESALMGYEDSLARVVRRVNPPLVPVTANPLVLRPKPVTIKPKQITYITQCLRLFGWAKISPSDYDDDVVLSGPPNHLHHDLAAVHLEADRRLLRGRTATKKERRTNISAAGGLLREDFLWSSPISDKKQHKVTSYGEVDDILVIDDETNVGVKYDDKVLQVEHDDITYESKADDDDETASTASNTTFGSLFSTTTINSVTTTKIREKIYPMQLIATTFSEIKPVMLRRVKKMTRRSSWVTGEEVAIDNITGDHRSLTSRESQKHEVGHGRRREPEKDSRATQRWDKVKKAVGVLGSGSTLPKGSLVIDVPGHASPTSSLASSPSNSATPGSSNRKFASELSPPSIAHHYTGIDQPPQAPGERLPRLVEGNEVPSAVMSRLQIPEIWVCGACNDGVVVFMRVIDNEEEVPRGTPVAELIRGEGAQAMRNMYAARRALCDDDHHHHHNHYEQLAKEQEEERERIKRSKKAHDCNAIRNRPFHRASCTYNETGSDTSVQRGSSGVHHYLHRHRFADYMTTNGRMLSVYAMKRLRHFPHIFAEMELPRPQDYFKHMAWEVYTNRHAWLESMNYIAKIQGLIRMRLARRRIALIKQELTGVLQKEGEAEPAYDKSSFVR